MKRQGRGIREQGTARPIPCPILSPFFWRQGGKAQKFIGPALVLLAALVAILPELVRGNSCGHDFDVHLVSWLDCVNAWRHGIPYPHWTPSANYDAGEPRFVFYPPLTWMLGAALGVIFPWSFAPIALTFLCLAGTGLATRALALEAWDNSVATLAGCASIFSGFALFTAYERAAFPEFAGGFWMPLLLLFALRDRNPSRALMRRAFDGSTALLAIALAGAWLSNAPLGVMASYLLAAVALLAGFLKKTAAPVLRASVAAVLGLGITVFYWLPAALERRWVDIRQAYDDPGYNFEHNWAFAHNASPVLAQHDVELHRVSLIAVSMIAVALAALAISWLRGTLPSQKSSRFPLWWIPLAAIPVVVLFLLFSISRPVWYLLPQWQFLQYPWRWMEAVEAPMAIFFAAAVWPSGRRSRMLVSAGCAAAFVGATVFAATSFFQVCYPEDTVTSTLADFRSGVGFEGMYEYEPPDSDRELIAMGLPDACLVGDPATTLGKEDEDGDLVWNPAQGSCEATFFANPPPRLANPEHRQMHVVIPRAGYLVLRLLSYPAWRVQVNGQTVTNLPKRKDGLLAVPVQPGPVALTVDWTITPDVVLSRWITGGSVLLLLWLYTAERRKRLLPSAARLS